MHWIVQPPNTKTHLNHTIITTKKTFSYAKSNYIASDLKSAGPLAFGACEQAL